MLKLTNAVVVAVLVFGTTGCATTVVRHYDGSGRLVAVQETQDRQPWLTWLQAGVQVMTIGLFGRQMQLMKAPPAQR